jgi:hypothetical protein
MVLLIQVDLHSKSTTSWDQSRAAGWTFRLLKIACRTQKETAVYSDSTTGMNKILAITLTLKSTKLSNGPTLILNR